MAKGWRTTWPRFAEKNGLTYNLPRGTLQPVVQGAYKDRTVEVSVSEEKSDVRDTTNLFLFLFDIVMGILSGGMAGPTRIHNPVRTRFVVEAQNPDQVSLSMKPMARVSARKHIGEARQLKEEFLIKSHPQHSTADLLTGALRSRLVASRGSFYLTGQRLTLEVPGLEANPERLQSHLNLACDLAEAVGGIQANVSSDSG